MKKILLFVLGALIAAAVLIVVFADDILADQPGFPILEYHMVQAEDPEKAWEYNVPPEDFQEQLDYLTEHGYTAISLKDYLRARKGILVLPRKPVILTFDVGYRTNYTELLPILKERHMKATVFMVVNYIGQDKYMTLDQLKDMRIWNIEVGSHTCNHLPMTGMSQDMLNTEIINSKLLMEWADLRLIYCLSYPNGKYNDEIIDMMKSAEYQAAVTGDAGLNTIDTDPFKLTRINIPHPVLGITEFRLRLLKGRVMSWLDIDQHIAQ